MVTPAKLAYMIQHMIAYEPYRPGRWLKLQPLVPLNDLSQDCQQSWLQDTLLRRTCISSPAVAKTIVGAHCTYPRRYGQADLARKMPGWYACQSSLILVLTGLNVR